jgi:hypothetical protein
MLSKRVITAARSRAFLASRGAQYTAVSLSKGWYVPSVFFTAAKTTDALLYVQESRRLAYQTLTVPFQDHKGPTDG